MFFYNINIQQTKKFIKSINIRSLYHNFLTTSLLIMILLGFALLSSSYVSVQLSLAQSVSSKNAFSDPNTGISLSYPSDWNIASQQYTNTLFGQSEPANSFSNNSSGTAGSSVLQSPPSPTSKPIALILPQSLDGSSVVVLSEVLPFPMPIDKYLEATKSHLGPLSMSAPTPVSIANTNGLKYTILLPNDLTQTQIAFIKDSQAFVIGYTVGKADQQKDLSDINSIINSVAFQTNNNNQQQQ